MVAKILIIIPKIMLKYRLAVKDRKIVGIIVKNLGKKSKVNGPPILLTIMVSI